MSEFCARVALPVPAAEAFAWHERPGALERMTPPWEPVRVVERSGTIRDGDHVVVAMGPLRMKHVHRDFVPGERFTDEQVRGPFTRFVHTHTIIPDVARSILEDRIDYAIPLGAGFVHRRLERMFAYRHVVLANDLARHAAARETLRIAITGASGMLGAPLAAFLSTGGHDVVRLVRRAPKAGELYWDPERGQIDSLEGVDVVIHLAGENVGKRWTAERKARVLQSRVAGTSLIARTLASLKRPPRALLSASAIGYYGAFGEHVADESSPPGHDFLADVCVQWERATAPARDAGIRVALLRIGVVLSPTGGALAEMLPIFRIGAGGPLGHGRQITSWVSLDDALYAIHHVMTNPLAGPVNIVAGAVTNAELADMLGRVLRRPAKLRVPARAIALAFGEMGRVVALGGIAVAPRKLVDTSYTFAFPHLEDALRHALGRGAGILRPC